MLVGLGLEKAVHPEGVSGEAQSKAGETGSSGEEEENTAAEAGLGYSARGLPVTHLLQHRPPQGQPVTQLCHHHPARGLPVIRLPKQLLPMDQKFKHLVL